MSNEKLTSKKKRAQQQDNNNYGAAGDDVYFIAFDIDRIANFYIGVAFLPAARMMAGSFFKKSAYFIVRIFHGGSALTLT